LYIYLISTSCSA